MENQRPSIDSIFFAALEKDTPEQMDAYLDKACGNDEGFRARVDKLLAAHRNAAASFLETLPSALQHAKQDDTSAGLAATLDPDSDDDAGGSGHSVLKSLSKSNPDIKQTTLGDSRQDRESVVQPDSKEIPKSDADDRYQLLGELARGGMGAIIKGRDSDLGRDLAIKVLLTSHRKKPELIQRFVEEAQIGGQLQHPCIVPIYDLGQFKDQRPFFAMKLVKGQTLASMLSDRRSPQEDLPRLLGIFEQVCQAMGYAHSKGVIHRDLKPANIMVGAFGEVQVMDWGLSKVLKTGGVADEQRSMDRHRDASFVETRRSAGSDVPGSGSDTMDGSVMGTLAYMPPEQAHGEVDRLDQRADVFGLGAILAEILTGKPPYVAKKGSDLLRMARRGKLDDCFKRLEASEAEAALVTVCKTSLSAEATDRFKDAEQLSAEVTKYLEGVQERLKQTELARVEAQARSEEEGRRKKLYLAIAGLMCVAAVGAVFSVIEIQKKNGHILEKNAELATTNLLLETETKEAFRHASRAKALQSLAEARALRSESTSKSLLVSAQAAELSGGFGLDIERVAHAALLETSSSMGGLPLGGEDALDSWWTQGVAQISADERWLVVGNGLFNLQAEDPWSSPTKLHDDSVSGLTIDRSSRWLATGGKRVVGKNDSTGLDITKGVIHLTDLKAGIDGPRRTLVDDSATNVSLLSFSPNARWLATTWSNTVRLWDVHDPASTAPAEILEFDESVHRIEFSPSLPDCLAIGCQNGSTEVLTTSIWKFRESKFERIRELPGSRTTFCPSGEWLATATVDEVYVWKIQDGAIAEEPLVIKASLGIFDSAPVFTPNGDHLITMGASQGGRVWNLREPDSSPLYLEGSGKGKLLVSDNNRWLVCSQVPYVWDLSLISADERPTPIDLGVIGNAIAISPDSGWLITGKRRWDLNNLQSVRSPTSIVSRASFKYTSFSDEKYIYTLLPDPNEQPFFQRFEFSPLEIQVSLTFPLGEGTSCAQLSDDKHWLAVGKADGGVELFDLSKSRMGALVSLQLKHTELKHTEAIHSLAISNDGQLLLTTSADRTVRLAQLEPSSNRIIRSSLLADDHDSYVSTGGHSLASISPNKRWLVVKKAPHPNGATLFRLDENFHMVDSFMIPPDKMYWDVIFSPKNNWALTRVFGASGDWLWNLNANDPTAAPTQLKGRISGSGFFAAAFSPDGAQLIVGENDGRGAAHLWNLKADDPPASRIPFTVGRSGVSAAISHDNKWIAVGANDSLVRLWCLDDEEPAAYPLVLAGHSSQVYGLDFHPTLPILVSHSQGGEIRLWNYDLESAVQDARRLVGSTLPPIEIDKLDSRLTKF